MRRVVIEEPKPLTIEGGFTGYRRANGKVLERIASSLLGASGGGQGVNVMRTYVLNGSRPTTNVNLIKRDVVHENRAHIGQLLRSEVYHRLNGLPAFSEDLKVTAVGLVPEPDETVTDGDRKIAVALDGDSEKLLDEQQKDMWSTLAELAGVDPSVLILPESYKTELILATIWPHTPPETVQTMQETMQTDFPSFEFNLKGLVLLPRL